MTRGWIDVFQLSLREDRLLAFSNCVFFGGRSVPRRELLNYVRQLGKRPRWPIRAIESESPGSEPGSRLGLLSYLATMADWAGIPYPDC
jgi:hypothetical protein